MANRYLDWCYSFIIQQEITKFIIFNIKYVSISSLHPWIPHKGKRKCPKKDKEKELVTRLRSRKHKHQLDELEMPIGKKRLKKSEKKHKNK